MTLFERWAVNEIGTPQKIHNIPPGDKVRQLKASTKDKAVWAPEVNKLLELKKQLAAAQAQPQAPPTSGDSVASLEKAIAEQGDKVRKLKASTKDKTVWAPEVNVLLDLKKKLAALQTNFWSIKKLLKGNLPLSLKRKLVDSSILPILTYGAQTWSLTEIQKSKLKVCQRAMERSILSVKRTDRIRNTTLRSKTCIADVGRETARLKWDWAGHICRMHPKRWAQVTTQWAPLDGQRRRGRPIRRWRDDLDAFRNDWQNLAADRGSWKSEGEAFAQQWDIENG
ncbi:hypothetical protein MSG28_014876 [Choristoneura fumiferana]|uniref:Uncharacterized protein n=1 Tax=Choristoneura fumiferana TaxID=7141 RepID=A0ACC0KYH6_CHOFU|nr:hypothetical protein MSG28_014876 [Choristoneura fumiferana]